MNHETRGPARRTAPRDASIKSLIAVAAVWMPSIAVHAAQIDTDVPDLKIRWDNTVKYSDAFRLKNRSPLIMSDVRTDDGDQNFDKGLVSNRIDLLSEFDASYQSIGGRVSAAAWYDTVYNKANDNDSAPTSNNVTVPYNRFTPDTRRRMGRDAEFLDAFVYAKGNVGDMAGTVRVGRHAVVYGETLFFGANGIANAQGPIDLVRLLAVPGTQFKEVLRPVPQISGQLQVTPQMSLGAYYQFKWEKTILPPAGSYLSTLDFVGEGAQSVFPGVFVRAADESAKNSGQGGVQMRYRLESIGAEIGLYASRYNDKTPQIYLTLDPAFQPASLVHTYAQDIRTFGASFSTSVGDANVAGEVSIRDNTPLVSDPQVILPTAPKNNSDDPAYAVGKTLHGQVSTVYSLPTTSLWNGGFFLGEIAWNRRLSISANAAAMDPNTTRNALAFRLLMIPSYYQVMSGLDITVPIGLGYNPSGKSSAVFAFNGGVRHGGDLSIGMTGDYQNKWQFGVNYVHYLGAAAPMLTPPNSQTSYLSYGQPLKDRDFLSFNIKRTF